MWLVDAALAPVGLLAAAVAVVSPAAILGVFPLAAMIAALAQERSYRIEQEVELELGLPGRRAAPRRTHRGRRPYTGEHSRGVVELSVEIAARDRHARPRAPASPPSSARSCTTSASSTCRTRSSTRPARSTTPSGRSCAATRSTARRCSPGSAACSHAGRPHRPRLARGLGRHRLPGRPGRRADPARRRASSRARDAFTPMTTDRSYRRALGHDKARRRAPALRRHAVRPGRGAGRDRRRRSRRPRAERGAARRPRGRRRRRGVARLRPPPAVSGGASASPPSRGRPNTPPNGVRSVPAAGHQYVVRPPTVARSMGVPQRGQTPSRTARGMTSPVWTPPPRIALRLAARIALRRRSSSASVEPVRGPPRGDRPATAPRRRAGSRRRRAPLVHDPRLQRHPAAARRARGRPPGVISAASGPRADRGLEAARPRRRCRAGRGARRPRSRARSGPSAAVRWRGRGSPASASSTTIRPAIPRCSPERGPLVGVSHHMDFPRRSAPTSSRPTSASAISPGACGRQT